MSVLLANRLLDEFEDHVRRIIEHPDRESKDVRDARGSFLYALENYINYACDERIRDFSERKAHGLV